MARKRKSGGGGEELPPWLVTYSDMMTLMLTFFVMLVAMATVDERRKLAAMGSIIGTFAEGSLSFDALTRTETRRTVEPGPLEDIGDLEMLKTQVWEDLDEDVRFSENKFVQIFSISADVLFQPGEAALSEGGQRFLDGIFPILSNVRWPLLVAGHTSTLRDELGESYKPGQAQTLVDPSWRISLGRSLAVYRHLLDRGMPADMLRTEAFGRFHPRFPLGTDEGRRMNRRVDLVLDKRNTGGHEEIVKSAQEKKTTEEYRVGGFVFQVGGPNGNATGVR